MYLRYGQEIPVLLNLTTSDINVGNAWIDRSGNGNDAVPSLGVFGQSGSYYSFNGTVQDPHYMYIKNLHFENAAISALELYVEFRTSYNGLENGSIADDQLQHHRHANWAFLDFDKSEWFTAYLRGDTHTATIDCRGNDSVSGLVHGTTALNDGQWHSVKYTFKVTESCDSLFEVVVDGNVEASLTNTQGGFKSGIGKLNGPFGQYNEKSQKRFGFIAEGSEAVSENGARNNHFYDGDIRAMTLKASTAATPCT
jgi:hypothetical protein